jgi:hypothetical protein
MPDVYSFNDYDQHLCLKVSPELWLVILYLLRPYLIWFSSLGLGGGLAGGGAQGVGGLREMIYPDDFSLALAMLATIPVIVFVYAWSKRNPGAKPLIKRLWHRSGLFLTTAAALNILVVFVPLLTMVAHKIVLTNWVQVGISVLIIWYLHSSQRVRDTFEDFPEEKKAEDAK